MDLRLPRPFFALLPSVGYKGLGGTRGGGEGSSPTMDSPFSRRRVAGLKERGPIRWMRSVRVPGSGQG